MDDKSTKQGERIAKVIARAGLCSRREAESWIAAGRVTVNGTVVRSPAVDVTGIDRVEVDGQLLPQKERTRLFLYHKPRGLVTTHTDPQGRPTIFAALPAHLPRLISIGRLDLNSEGLLLLTNDGGLARALELPETGWLRRYRVRALGRVTQLRLDGLRNGITVEGVRYGPIEATIDREQGANVWLTVAMREGKNREVRNVLGALDLQVNRLIRVSYGPFQLGELPEGAIEEVRTRHLREQIGEKLVAEAHLDFAGPIGQAPPAEKILPPRPSPPPTRGTRGGEGSGGGGKRRAKESPHPDAFSVDPPRRSQALAGRGNDHAASFSERSRDSRNQHDKGGRDDRGKGRSETSGRDRDRKFKDGERGFKGRDDKKPRRKQRHHSDTHAWRGGDAPLRRKFRGAESAVRGQREEPAAKKKSGLVADRKGRRILVERFGDKPPEREDKRRTDKRRNDKPSRSDAPRRHKRSSFDRAAGPRPARPRGPRER